MIDLILLLSLHADNPYDWQMDCSEFIQAKQRIMEDKHFDQETRTNLINYFRTKLNEPCNDVFTSRPKYFDSLSNYI